MTLLVSASSARNGSSRSSTLGSFISARTSSTRRRMPEESSPGYWPSIPERPVRASRCRACASACARGRRPCSTGPQVTFQSTVFHGKRAPCWNTTIRSAPGDRRLPGAVRVLAVHDDLARGQGVEARDDVEQRRFPAARRTDDDAELAGGNVERDFLQGDDVDALRVVHLADFLDAQAPVRTHHTNRRHRVANAPICQMSALKRSPARPMLTMAVMMSGITPPT